MNDFSKQAGVHPLLNGHENEILFRTHITPQDGLVQARQSNQNEMQNFLRGGKGSNMLEGKVRANQTIIERFAAMVGSDEDFEKAFFEPKDSATRRYGKMQKAFQQRESGIIPQPAQELF
jgi:hypothetical protein